MKRLLAMTTATLMGASMIAAPAFAQTGGEGGANDPASSAAEQNASPSQDSGSQQDVDRGTTQAIDDGAGDGGSLTAVTGSGAAAQSIASMDSFSDVTVRRISGEESANASEAVSQNRDAITQLQSAISGNAELMSRLEAEGVEVSSIVGAEVAGNGALVLYQL